MIQVLSETKRKAIKDHYCNAGLFIRDELHWIRKDIKMTFSEWRAIANLKSNNWKIIKGQQYTDSRLKYDDVYTFKSLDSIHNICIKYELYPEL